MTHAQGVSRVVIVRTAGDGAIVARVRTELVPTEFEVREIEADGASTRSPLAGLAQTHAASAALRVRSASISAELWSADGGPGALDVITVPEAETHGEEVLALRIVETLRARSLGFAAAVPQRPVEARPEPQPDAAASPAATSAAAPETNPGAEGETAARTPQLWLELAPALALSGGGLEPGLGVLLGARVSVSSLLSIGAFAVAPLWREELETSEGSATISTWLLGSALDARARWRAWELSAGAGLATVLTQMSGSAPPPFEGDDSLETSAAPFLRASVQLDVGSALRVSLRGMLGVALPEIAVRFDDREVARWGRPFALLSLGVEVPLGRL